ncbi:MAG: RNB domain-containing ribonuclease [Planctomycetota bacterium]
MSRDDSKKKNKKNTFSSFADLQRALGGGEESDAEETAEPEAEEPGWTLKRAGEDIEPDLENLPEVRKRRPAAFGPMAHGPKPYHDVDSEEMQLLKSFRVRSIFPPDVQEEVSKLPADPRPEDFAGRLDLREEVVFTIDGADAKDYDDAISMKSLEDDHVELGVHIADVGHYVVDGTALDAEAQERGTSVYVADQVIPMLPEELSNNLCSLVPNRDRLAYSVFMEFDRDGRRVAYRMAKTVIRSKFRCTYKNVQGLFDGVEDEETAKLKPIEETLLMLRRWTQTQQLRRDQAGSLRMQSTEKKFVFDENHEVKAVVNAPNYFSQTLIEETALAANQAVGDFFRDRGLPTIYRVHPEKDPEELEGVIKMLEKYRIRVPFKDRLTGRDIGNLVRAARGRPNSEAMIQRIMGLVERADYQIKDHEDVAKHWGLAREAYLHFTSPIRRYPDLIVHRWLHAVQQNEEAAGAQLREGALLEDLNMKASHSTLQASIADMVEKAVFDLKVCQFVEPRIDEVLTSKVLRISRGGIEVSLGDLNVTGFLPFRKIGGRAQVDGSSVVIHRGKRSLSFSEGGEVQIKIADVDFVRLQVLLDLAG